MPPIEVYKVNFANGNLKPKSNLGWGDMVYGGIGPDSAVTRVAESKGLKLTLFRAPGSPPFTQVSNSVYVIPPANALRLSTRLMMRLRFDLPDIIPIPPANPEDNPPQIEPWAVALRIKYGNQVDLADPVGEPTMNVTCQFNRSAQPGANNGVRLNTLAKQQDPIRDLDSPLDYLKYRPGCMWFGATKFVLEFAFCGIQAGPTSIPGHLGYAVASGSLNIGGKWDHRVFSNSDMSIPSQSPHIDPVATVQPLGALGISLASLSGIGTCMVRLREFTLFLWV